MRDNSRMSEQRVTTTPEHARLVDRLNLALAALELTPRGLSIKAGLKPDAVRQIINGRSLSPRIDTLEALQARLGNRLIGCAAVVKTAM
jgi:hypothetical protein